MSGLAFEDMRAYARWLDVTNRTRGARLCTDREWERAARGADDRRYAHGNALRPGDTNYMRTYDDDWNQIAPDEVGSYPVDRSPFGVLDLSGNVGEGVVDEVRSHASTPGAVLMRGGCWFCTAEESVITSRSELLRNGTAGFRVCADPPVQPQ
jgi:eukaryotic-like serine/threonine-protein kinase